MAGQVERERHNINLSRQVWGELKLRSFQEGVSASELVAYVIDQYVNGVHGAGGHGSVGYTALPRYQARSSDEDRLGRTVFLPAPLWQQVQQRAARSSTSVSGLIEYLLKRYLGLLPDASQESPEPDPAKTVRIGEERVYLGENPIRIDLKKDKPAGKE